MPPPSKRPELGKVLKAPVAYALRSKQGLRDGFLDAHGARLEAPHPSEHARRFLYGFAAPLTFLRLSWRHAPTRRLMVRSLTAPLLCMSLATSIGVVWAVTGLAHTREEKAQKEERSLHLAFGDDDGAQGSKHAGKAAKAGARKTRGKDTDDEDNGADEDNDEDENDEAAGKALVAEVDKDLHTVDFRDPSSVKNAAERIRVEALKVAPPPAAAAAAPPPLAAAPPDRFSVIRTALDILESRIVQVLATLGVIEWILVWIGREHHDQIAYEASVLAGVPGEPLAAPPSLRLDFGWLWLKLWRAARFFLFLALVGPFAWLLGKIPYAGDTLAVGVELVWAAYWSCVFAIANTFLAWEPIAPGEAPWFIRVLGRIGRVPLLGLPFQLYSWVLTLATRKVWPACMAFERTTWESAGLATARVIGSAPFLYLVFRPMFTPAATHAYVARRESPPAPEAASAVPPVSQGPQG